MKETEVVHVADGLVVGVESPSGHKRLELSIYRTIVCRIVRTYDHKTIVLNENGKVVLGEDGKPKELTEKLPYTRIGRFLQWCGLIRVDRMPEGKTEIFPETESRNDWMEASLNPDKNRQAIKEVHNLLNALGLSPDSTAVL